MSQFETHLYFLNHTRLSGMREHIAVIRKYLYPCNFVVQYFNQGYWSNIYPLNSL